MRTLIPLLLCTTLLAACSPANAPTSAAPAQKAQRSGGAGIGDYRAGSRVVLANGMSFKVPRGWSGRVYTKGALIGAHPVSSGAIGSLLQVPAAPHWGSATAAVYGPGAGFDQELARVDSDYERSHSTESSSSFSMRRSRLMIDPRTGGRSYVIRTGGSSPRYEIRLFIERSHVDPLVIAATFDRLPAELIGTPDDELPSGLLGFLSFRTRAGD